MEQFEAYLRKKRIDPVLFRESLPGEWDRLLADFLASGEKAFEQQKRFMLNPLRMQFALPEEE